MGAFALGASPISGAPVPSSVLRVRAGARGGRWPVGDATPCAPGAFVGEPLRPAPPRPRPPRRRRGRDGAVSPAVTPVRAASLFPFNPGAGRVSPMRGLRDRSATRSSGDRVAPASASVAFWPLCSEARPSWPDAIWPPVGSDIEGVPSRAHAKQACEGHRALRRSIARGVDVGGDGAVVQSEMALRPTR